MIELGARVQCDDGDRGTVVRVWGKWTASVKWDSSEQVTPVSLFGSELIEEQAKELEHERSSI